jgi:hypothetical protein
VAGSTSSSFLAGYNPIFLDPYGLQPNGGSFVAALDAAGNLTQATIFDYGRGHARRIPAGHARQQLPLDHRRLRDQAQDRRSGAGVARYGGGRKQ